MPPEQETTIAANIPPISTRPETSSVHHEPEASATNKIKPSLELDDNGIPSQHHTHPTPPPPPRLSVLHQSLRPITLKVLIHLLSPHHIYLYVTFVFILFHSFKYLSKYIYD